MTMRSLQLGDSGPPVSSCGAVGQTRIFEVPPCQECGGAIYVRYTDLNVCILHVQEQEEDVYVEMASFLPQVAGSARQVSKCHALLRTFKVPPWPGIQWSYLRMLHLFNSSHFGYSGGGRGYLRGYGRFCTSRGGKFSTFSTSKRVPRVVAIVLH